jgi:hypothetical protein
VTGSAQFKAAIAGVGTGDEMGSSGFFGAVAQPAKKINAPEKKMTPDLITRQLCETSIGTQVVFPAAAHFYLGLIQNPRL